MKNIKFVVLAIAAATVFVNMVSIVAFSTFEGSIRGKIIPADGVSEIWGMSSADTVKASINQGNFEISNAKSGTYKVYIDAVAPYKDIVKDGIQVGEGTSVDLGEIQLEK